MARARRSGGSFRRAIRRSIASKQSDVLALNGRLDVVPARSMSDIIGLYPDIDTSSARDDRDRL